MILMIEEKNITCKIVKSFKLLSSFIRLAFLLALLAFRN